MSRKVADEEVTTVAGFFDSANLEFREVHSSFDPKKLLCTYYNYFGPGGYTGDDGPATSALLNSPRAVAVGSDGSLYIAEKFNNVVRKVSLEGTITTFAGNGEAGYAGDGGVATSAELNRPEGVAVGPDGSVYVADTCNAVVRRISPLATITTVAGDGHNGGYGYGGPATSAELENPYAIAVDSAGNIFLNGSFHEVLKVNGPLGPGDTTDSGGNTCPTGGGGG